MKIDEIILEDKEVLKIHKKVIEACRQKELTTKQKRELHFLNATFSMLSLFTLCDTYE